MWPWSTSRDFVAANSKLSISRSASFVAGPAAGGLLIQALTAPLAMLADALSFLLSALLIGRIKVAPAEPPPHRSLLADARAGLQYVVTHRYLRAGLGCVTTVNFFGFVAQALVVLFATRTLGLPVVVIGLALGAAEVAGGVLGSVVGLRPTLLLAAVGGMLGSLWLLRSPLPRVRTVESLQVTAPQETGERPATESGRSRAR